MDMVSQLGDKGNNIRVLPKERSFVASWGSFDIVRAELEVRSDLDMPLYLIRLGLRRAPLERALVMDDGKWIIFIESQTLNVICFMIFLREIYFK